MLGRQMLLVGGETENVPLYYHMHDNFQIQFGREEFCLVTGLKFEVEYSADYDDEDKPIPFRRRMFPSCLDGKHITRKNVEDLIKSKSFKKLDDDNVVSLCCIGILQLVLLGVEDRRASTNEDDKKSYSIFGFTWAFKTWILEVFRSGWNEYYTRHRRYQRVVAWTSNKKFYRHMLRDFLHGRVPAERLIQDEVEAGSGWWLSSRAYFDGCVTEAERRPCHLNRQNHYEVPSEFYRDFQEQRSGEDSKREVTQNDYTLDQMIEWAKHEHYEDEEIKEVQRRHLKNLMSMASSANDARKTIVSKLQRKIEVEATFANQLLCNLTCYREQMRIREIQMTMMQNMPTTSLNSYGLHALLMTHEADIRTTNNLIRARQELLRSIAEKQNFINSYMSI
ncbi:phospholipase-like protein [Tanacetum coccineum]